MTPEHHLFILWQRARYNEEKILQDMEQHFCILRKYAITWTPKLVASNFTRFYGVNLPPKSGKEKECGTGEFLLCVVRDDNPVYEERMTSRGIEVVNVNMFDAKTRYRQWTQGGHKVHGTNNEKETNHDLTLLIGQNVEDFLTDCKEPDSEVKRLQRDIEGANGWGSIQQLFYVLNNTVSYVILRGTSEFEQDCYLDRSDTDILTTDYQNLWHIVNGEAVYHHVRPKSKIIVNGRLYYLDLWDSKKNYFDPFWVEQMFETHDLFHGMNVLNPENDFYCILYHCITNKGNIADKYTAKLQEYKRQFRIQETDWNQILVNWLSANHYEIIEHTDPSNPFNISNPIINNYALRYGKCFRVVKATVKDVLTNAVIQYTNRVYKKQDSYVKAGTPWLIDNEVRFLERIGDGVHFPKLIAFGEDEGEHWLEQSTMLGRQLFEDRWGIRLSDIRSYAQQCLALLEMLYKNNIIHRDIQHENIIVSADGNLSIIDFAFAIDFQSDKNYFMPKLCKFVSPEEGYSDFYNLARIFENRFGSMPFVERFALVLKRIDWNHYADKEFVNKHISDARIAIQQHYSIRDIYEFCMSKYKLRKYIRNPHIIWEKGMSVVSHLISFSVKLPRKVFRKIKKLFKW